MKKNLLILMLVVLFALNSGLALAQEDMVENFNEKQLETYNHNLTTAERTNAYLQTGITIGTLTHSIEDAGLKMEDEFEQKFLTNEFGVNVKFNGNYIKSANFLVESMSKEFESDFNQTYTNEAEDFEMAGTNNSKAEKYNKIDGNLIFSKDLRKSKNYLLMGLGYQKEEKTLASENGSLTIVGTGDVEYDTIKYSYNSKKPYISLKAYAPESEKKGYMFENHFKVFPYITSENTLNIDGSTLTTDFKGWGIDYSLEINKEVRKNVMFGIGYNFRYQSLESEGEEGGKSIADVVVMPVDNSQYDLTEEMTESNHSFFAKLTFLF